MSYYSYLGTSIKTPLSFTNGSCDTISGSDNLQQGIHRLLSTEVNDVFFNRNWGSRVNEVLFKVNSDNIKTMLETFIRDSMKKFEKRCKFVAIEIEVKEHRINCIVRYKILTSNEIDSLIVPFYTNN